jgi:hypothetical protein
LIALANQSLGQEKKSNLIDIQNLFTPSGWMGDGEYGREYILFSGANRENPHSPPDCIKIEYTFGPKAWGGIYWQNQPDNWGDMPGNNYAGIGISKVTFWARGETGTEVVEFKSGGIKNANKKHNDSFIAGSGMIQLSDTWKKYQIDLSKTDLRNVLGGFCWVAGKDYNAAKKITFYLDDIFFE